MGTARGRSISVFAEQPDPGHIKPWPIKPWPIKPWHIQPRRLGHEGLSRLGHVPDALLDRFQILLARLTNATLVGPLLMTLGAALLGGRALDIGVTRFGKR